MTAKTIENLSLIEDNTTSYVDYNNNRNLKGQDSTSFLINTISQRKFMNLNEYNDLYMNTNIKLRGNDGVS